MVIKKFFNWNTSKIPRRGQINIFSCVQYHFDDSVQDCSKSIAYALELLQSYTKPSIWSRTNKLICITAKAGILTSIVHHDQESQ